MLVVGDVLFDRGAMTSRSEAIAGLAGEPWVLIHPDDAARAGAADGEPVVLTSRRGSVAVRTKVSTATPVGQVYLPRGYDAAPANTLADDTTRLVGVRVSVLVAAAGGPPADLGAEGGAAR